MDLWTHFWTLYFEGKIRDLKVNIDLYTTGDSYFYYCNKTTEYRQALRNFIVDKENEKIVMLCDTLGVNEKQSWQMIKPK